MAMELQPGVALDARGVADACHLDITSGLSNLEGKFPKLIPLDDYGQPFLHVTDPEQTDVDYHVARIDYFKPDFHVAASRRISIVTAGFRTKSIFMNGGSRKAIEVHKGAGFLIIGGPSVKNQDFDTAVYPINPSITPLVVIEPHHFYTFEAASWGRGPLILSELHKIEGSHSLGEREVELRRGQTEVATESGPVAVPDDFVDGVFR